MNALNDHQLRIWRKMLSLIEDFRHKKIKYYDFVGALEGAFDAGEFHEKSLIENWYDFWTPLESVRAQKGNDVTFEEINKDLSSMEDFLNSYIY